MRLEHLYFAEQWAFAIARQDLHSPYAVLALALNFPLSTRGDQRPGGYIQERFLPHAIEPRLLHHHDHFEDGLRPSGLRAPRRGGGARERAAARDTLSGSSRLVL